MRIIANRWPRYASSCLSCGSSSLTAMISRVVALVEAPGSPRSRAKGIRQLVNVVLVVTPSLNAERYIEQTILSVAQQRGDFEIRYHVQDGGSTDATVAITQAW